MLNVLRNHKVQKNIYIVLAVAVIATFAVSGIYLGREGQKTASSIGRLDGKNISVQDYLASYKALDHQARIIYANTFDQVRPYLDLKGQAWDRLLLLNYAKKQGIRTGDEEVVRWIGAQEFLQSKGRFDQRVYKLFVTQYLHEDERRFEEEIRETLTIGKIQQGIEHSLPAGDAAARKKQTQERMDKLLEDLRKNLKPNLALLKEIFPEEEKNKP